MQACSDMVPVAGVEPARVLAQRILSPPRLPIPTHRQKQYTLYTTGYDFSSLLILFSAIDYIFNLFKLFYRIYTDNFASKLTAAECYSFSF